MAYRVSNGDVTDDVTSLDPQRCCEVVWSAILATAWLLVFNFFTELAYYKDKLGLRTSLQTSIQLYPNLSKLADFFYKYVIILRFTFLA